MDGQWVPGADFGRLQRLGYHHEQLGISLDVSRALSDPALAALEGPLGVALEEMRALEGGALANADEERMVGHYWLRAPDAAPSADISCAIRAAQKSVWRFSAGVHDGQVAPQAARRFRQVLLVGIGGSALGPQLVADALRTPTDPLGVRFIDNTDPQGAEQVLTALAPDLDATLTVVVSKSGGTKETRNGMLMAARAYRERGLHFGRHAVAVTGEGSKLAAYAREQCFIECFPMWDWVGGRTSVTSAVGLLPAALQGIDTRALLDGARQMDEATRAARPAANPAALLAAAWHRCGGGRGRRAMVVIPYADRLMLLSRYLQQLIMESLGKRLDRHQQQVHQGLTVYGNKGSTDQHAYVQQLLDGPDDCFLTFIEVLDHGSGGASGLQVEPGVCSGDYLSGFVHGSRRALTERGRASVLLSIERVDARRVGALIALYERAVGLYASLIDINAYHQPAVESGKRAAAEVLALQGRLLDLLERRDGQWLDAAQAAQALGEPDVEQVMRTLWHLSANGHHQVQRRSPPDEPFWRASYARSAISGVPSSDDSESQNA